MTDRDDTVGPEFAEAEVPGSDRTPSPTDAAAEPVAQEPELPADLLALQASLEQPTGEMSVVEADMPQPEAEPSVAEILDQIEPGTVAVATEQSAEAAEQPAAVEGAQPGAESVAPTDGSEPPAEATGEVAEGAEVEGAEVEGAEPAEAAQSAAAEQLEEALAEGPVRTVPWWPFIVYDLVWLAVAGYAIWQLQQTPASIAPYETYLYSVSLVVGLALLAVGPALILIVWLASLIGRQNRKIGAMFISALVKGASATLLGAIIWLGAIMITDYLHLGRPF